MNYQALPFQTTSITDQKRLYDQASRLARIGAWECDLTTETLIWTDGVYDLFGLPRGSTPHRATALDLYEDDSRQDMELLRADAIRAGGGFMLDARIRTRGGTRRWMRLSAEVAYEGDRPVRIFGAKQDITQEKLLWDLLKQQAERDPLTGLPNRRLFEERCHAATGSGVVGGSAAALALIDLNGFKQINDGFGHAAGDECLRQVATRLSRSLSGAIVVARIGGDEFAVLLRAPLDRVQVTRTLERALRGSCRPIAWKGRRIDVRVSVGVAMLASSERRDPWRLLEEADNALYAAKAAGGRCIRVFGRDPVPESQGPHAMTKGA